MKRNALKFVTRCALACLTLSVMVGLLGTSVGCASKGTSQGQVTEVPSQSFVRGWTLDLNIGKAKVEWMRETGDFLVVFTSDRLAHVIRKSTGRLLTIHEIKGNGPVLEPFTNGKILAYPVSTAIEVHDLNGKTVRTVELDQAVQSTGAMSDSTMFISVSGLNGGRMRAVDPTRPYNTPKWEILTFGAISAAPVYFDQSLFFANVDGHVYAVTDTRLPVWNLEKGYFTAGPVLADLAVDSFGLYVASTDTKLITLDRATGKVKWQYYAGQPLYNRPIPTAENVYLEVQGEGVVALNKLDGDYNRKAKWTNHEGARFLSEDSRYAYVAMKNNALAALDKGNGSVAFRSGPTDLKYYVANQGTDGMIYGVTEKGVVLGIKPVTRPGTVGEMLYTPVGK